MRSRVNPKEVKKKFLLEWRLIINLDDVSCGGNGGFWTHHSDWTLGIAQIGSDAHIHPLFWVCWKPFLVYSFFISC